MSGPDWIASVFLFAQSGAYPTLFPALYLGGFITWVILSLIPAILLSATDEQSCLMAAAGQTLVRSGHGLEAIRLTALGSLIGLALLAILIPIAAPFLPLLHRILAPHYGWIVWCSILLLVLSERPRSAPTALLRWDHITYTLAPVMAGLATLTLSSLLGIVLYYRSPIPLTASFLNFVPAIIGLFTVPGLILQLFTPSHYPACVLPPSRDRHSGGELLHATGYGALAGLITALVPALTGAMGALLTQQLAGTRSVRTQLVAQGVTRMLYYGAGLLLIFMPGTPRMRSSSAALLRTFFEPTPSQVWLISGVIVVSALVAWLILPLGAKVLLRVIARQGPRPVALLALAAILIFVVGTTSWPGLLILLTASGIGLIPPLFQARPIMAIGVVLVPTAIMLTF